MSTNLIIPAPRKAEKKRVKLKLAIQGPSGSGKTWGALALANNLWPNAKICVIDTENESASLYADSFDFDTIPLSPPFGTDRYAACIDAVIKAGYDVAIIDSLSHQWDGEGGILRRKEELDRRPGANSYTNWSAFTPEHTRFKEKIVQSPLHIIATMRSKQDYILETNEKGKQQPRKIGMAPIQREGFDYEFSLVFDVQMDHRAIVDKNRTGLFDGEVVNLADPKIAERLSAWLSKGVEAPAAPLVPAAQPAKPNGSSSNGHSTAEVFKVTDNRMVCVPKDVLEKKTKKGSDYLAIPLNGSIGKHSIAFCWHANLWNALRISKCQNCQFEIAIDANDKYLTIENVLEINGQEYRDGMPYVEEPEEPEAPRKEDRLNPEITDDDIPF